MQASEEIQEKWDKKKIFIGILAVLVIGGTAYAFKDTLFGSKENDFRSSKKVAGTTTEEEGSNTDEPTPAKKNSSLPRISTNDVNSAVAQGIENIKQQINNLGPEDIASSSPQVKKILQDIKTLEQYPKNQAKEMCENICKSF